MKSKIIIKCLEALLLLIFVSAESDVDFKQRFGNEFIPYMQKNHADLLKKDLSLIKNIYEKLLSEMEPTSQEAETFKSGAERIEKVIQEIDDTTTIVELAKKMADLTLNELNDIRSFSWRAADLPPKSKEQILKTIFDENSVIEKQNLEEFQLKIYEKYHEMYKGIPNEELIANPEYTKIDQALESVAFPEKSLSEEKNMAEYLAIFKLVGDFFDVPTYKELQSLFF